MPTPPGSEYQKRETLGRLRYGGLSGKKGLLKRCRSQLDQKVVGLIVVLKLLGTWTILLELANWMRPHTFNEMDEKIGFVEIVRQPKVETAQRYGAVATAADAVARRSRARRRRSTADAVHLLKVELLAVVRRRVVG